jgi:hypothetical protein
VCPVDCSAILESIESISLDERGDFPVILFPSETQLVSVVNDCLVVFECPTRLDFDVEVNRTVEVWSVFKDESVSPVTLFLVEPSILNPVLNSEVIVGEQFVSELDAVLECCPEISMTIHHLHWTYLGSCLYMPCSLSVTIGVFPIVLLDFVVVLGRFSHRKHREDVCYCCYDAE